MLRKLIKHELRATGRVMLPAFLVVILLAIGSNFSVRLLDSSDNTFLNLVGGLIVVAFGISLVALLIIPFVQMINRFRTNLMGDEGYIMFTLPASVHHLLWSKLIVSSLWFAAMLVMEFLAAMFMVMSGDVWHDFWTGLSTAINQVLLVYGLNGPAILFEVALLFFVGCISLCLIFYASLAAGHSFDRHKTLLSIGFFFLFTFVSELIGTFSLLHLGTTDYLQQFASSPVAVIHASMWTAIGSTAVFCVVFYLITTLFLKRRLNLA